MSRHIAMTAQKREKVGKGAARAVRRTGHVPAVIYGDKKPPVSISLDERAIMKELNQGSLFTHLCDINVDGEKFLVLARDVQLDPLKGRPIHADFLRVTENTRIYVMVPVEITGEEESPGIDRGGILSVIRHEIEVLCRATDIPEHITVDVSQLDIGDSAHISQVKLPGGVTPAITDRDFTIATVLAPTLAVEEETETPETVLIGEEGEEGAEGGEGAEGEAKEAREDKKASDKD